MFLRNFDNAMLLQLGVGQSSTTSISTTKSVLGTTFGDGSIAIKTTEGSNNGFRAGSIGSSTSVYCNYLSLLSLQITDICLGDGNIPVTYEDYKLSGNLIENKLVKISSNIVYNHDTKEFIQTLVATYNNNSEKQIVINEWGLFTNNYPVTPSSSVSSTKGTYSNNGNYILLYHEVLDEPVIIEAGTTATLTFTLRVGLMHQV